MVSKKKRDDLSDLEGQMPDLSALFGGVGPVARVKELFAGVVNAACDASDANVVLTRARVKQFVSDQADTADEVETAKSEYGEAQKTVKERVSELPGQLRDVVEDNVDISQVHQLVEGYSATAKATQQEFLTNLLGAVHPRATMELMGLAAQLQTKYGDQLQSAMGFFSSSQDEEPPEER